MHERMFHHHHADKLDDPERLSWLTPDDLLARLSVPQGQQVADIGAGTGFFALPLARALGHGGRVWAVDRQPEMLQRIGTKLDGSLPVTPVLGDAARTHLPAGIADMAFYANVWHELDDPAAVLAEAARILVPNGRIAILDWRTDLSGPPGPPDDHRIAPETIVATMAQHGWQEAESTLIGVYTYLVTAIRPET